MRNDFDVIQHDREGYLFIAGAPRSGTQYIAHVFQGIGIDLRHEEFGEQGISAFHIIPSLANCKQGKIFHQVREPLKTISSMQTIDPSWHLIYNATGISPEQGGMLYAVMYLWVMLNLHIEKYAHLRYKVEDIDTAWPILLAKAGIPDQPLPGIPTNTHTRKGKFKDLSWAELEFRDIELTKQIKDMSYRYGYGVE
jgi:hypothetical protein